MRMTGKNSGVLLLTLFALNARSARRTATIRQLLGPGFAPCAESRARGRKLLSEVAEPYSAIEGVADADFIGPASVSGGSTMHRLLRGGPSAVIDGARRPERAYAISRRSWLQRALILNKAAKAIDK